MVGNKKTLPTLHGFLIKKVVWWATKRRCPPYMAVLGAEEQIKSHGNHIVYGRRGAGKSSLLAFFMHSLRKEKKPYAWVAMQTYSGREDIQVVTDVLMEIVEQLQKYNIASAELGNVRLKLELLADEADDKIVEKQLNRLRPKIRKALALIAEKHGSLFIFIDDVHLIKEQPVFLNHLYAICRDNRIFLKISGIEQFVKTYDPFLRQGLEKPHDAQEIRLDYNLTLPNKSKNHIKSILDAHAIYCALPDISYLCGKGVLDRLVWVAAGVPRDALYIFSKAISRSVMKDEKKVSISSIHAAASEMVEGKLKDMQQDIFGDSDEVKAILEKIRSFCIDEKRKNAFLVEIKNENTVFVQIQQLIALRLLHVIHEGITPRKAGRRFIALMLDYGFYVGIRAARSVDLFQKEPKALTSHELRKLPIFPLS
ncbi:ATP-binding protein [Candidatus Marithioploca araucensis]|uniref:ATP-binding protein n=1 Tax=Candidatus Marithioploca araucensis TaxID=70273 RepID=A0ABT7VS82_9GAMM|nr:ATP-binding protein [Candidatus Marithioploca araucensis]